MKQVSLFTAAIYQLRKLRHISYITLNNLPICFQLIPQLIVSTPRGLQLQHRCKIFILLPDIPPRLGLDVFMFPYHIFGIGRPRASLPKSDYSLIMWHVSVVMKLILWGIKTRNSRQLHIWFFVSPCVWSYTFDVWVDKNDGVLGHVLIISRRMQLPSRVWVFPLFPRVDMRDCHMNFIPPVLQRFPVIELPPITRHDHAIEVISANSQPLFKNEKVCI